MIFETFKSLNKGGIMELAKDHGLRAFNYQMLHEYTDIFEWKYIDRGQEFGE